ncbi:MAG: acetyltransferase [Francisellaceae bacterium]|nr:acetyltransferase [Francisellaceae bacterium]
MLVQNLESKIIIEGVTDTGEIFRPSDWAERISGVLCTFQNHRIHYSPLLKPSIQNNHSCVILDKSLKTINPSLYSYILDFAQKNKLKMIGIGSE